MNQYPGVVIFNKKSDAVKRHHPWIFSGAIKKLVGKVEEGSIVEVHDENGEFLAVGHYSPGSIAVRVFSFKPIEDIQQFLQHRFASALTVRVLAGLADNSSTNVFRLINAEGDGMPGLIIDFYNGTAVLQAHSRGMHNLRNEIIEALKFTLGDKLNCVYDKSAAVLDKKSSAQSDSVSVNYLFGTKGNDIVHENGNRFSIDWETGQKTGFFIDQRDNRALLAQFSENKKVLNTFCYSGGFSVYALKAGASEVHSTDSSAKAIELTNNNVALNNLDVSRHKSITADIFDFLRTADADYDVIVLDPPAFAKNQNARHQAVQAYKRLNAAAFKKIKQGGIIFTFSCSQAVSPEFFNGAVMAAAIESRRNIRILHHLTQPADHPISIFHPEGLYLKGLVLQVE
jgi:23S rRNA (cytosine1962-C5)-methyltransferase